MLGYYCHCQSYRTQHVSCPFLNLQELLMNEQNPHGAYLVRVGNNGATVLSLKYMNTERNEFKIVHHEITREVIG